MAQQLRQGKGWRLGWNPDAETFHGLVGGTVWAVELTGPEFEHFCRLSLQLAETLHQISDELMDEEAIACEASSELIWMEIRGYAHTYSMSFILLSGRRAEGEWHPLATAELMQAVQTLQVF